MLVVAGPGQSRGFSAESCADYVVTVRVVGVDDARAVALDDGRTLRIAGIESFALLADDGEAAETALRDRLADLMAGTPIRARILETDPDRYGRLPALAWTQEGSVQGALLAEGLAIAVETNDDLPCFDEMLAAEDSARRAGRGFWAGRRLPEARPWALAGAIGRFAVFEGEVLSVGNRPSTTYLNFGAWWQEDVTAEIAERDRERFGGEGGLAGLAGKRVRLRGFLEEKGGPMLKLRSPLQLEILGPDALANGETP